MKIAVLFLGETLLIPHLYPIVEALAARRDLAIDLWVSTSVHEDLLARWTADLAHPALQVRRAPGFRKLAGYAPGQAPPLPPKLPMLVALAPQLLAADAVLCAEQTSLWLPALLPFAPPFVKTSHGVGSMSARDDPRRRAAALLLVPGERERQTYLQRGFDPDRVLATGYVKAAFHGRTGRRPKGFDERPIVLYTPHWRRRRSSWWAWGPELVRRLADDGRFNVILAPHQRLATSGAGLRDALAAVAGRRNVHADLDSFATVDGSYTAAADIYLGDTSSQVVEFLMRPRPCVFLNPGRMAWRRDPAYDQWRCGEVMENLDDVLPALARAPAQHPRFAAIQAAFARASLGDTGPESPRRAAREIVKLLSRRSAAGLALDPAYRRRTSRSSAA